MYSEKAQKALLVRLLGFLGFVFVFVAWSDFVV
jgi:hypothetical protein